MSATVLLLVIFPLAFATRLHTICRMKFRVSLALITSAVAGVLNLLAGADWPEFRGPTGQGHILATNLPIHWDAKSGVAWKSPIPGSGWSSPILVRDRLYLTTAAQVEGGNDLSLRTLCLDAGTGAIVWNVEVFKESSGTRIHNKNSHASPTPLFSDGVLYVHFGHEGTAALTPDGKILWRQTSLRYSPVHGNGGSPIRVGDSLFFACDGAADPFVTALDIKTGQPIWKTPRVTPASRKFSFSTALLITNAGKAEIISPGSGAVCAYDPADGHERWRVLYGEGYSVVPRPVFGLGLLFIGTGYDRPNVIAVEPGGNGDVTATNLRWTITKGAPNTPSMLLLGEDLYLVSDGGIASCVDARTGKVHWSERLGGDFSASLLYGEGRIYFQNENGQGFVVAAGHDFKLLATNDLGERSLASYAATDGSFFIRTEQNLFRINSQ